MTEKIFGCISSLLIRLGSLLSFNINIINVDSNTITHGRDVTPHAIQQENMAKNSLDNVTDDKYN